MNHKITAALWFIALFAGLLACLSFSWNLLASQDYGYHWLYDSYHIEQHIAHYAPQNNYILGLDRVGRVEHERLFSDIVAAVHQQGKGLADIRFQPDDVSLRLLRPAEVIHLQDVANLVDVFQTLGLIATVILVILAGWLLLRGTEPHWRQQLVLLLGLVLVMTLTTLALGAKTVFYQLHVWMFPPEHEWFFYYQDSLMTTLMKAPDIFAGISAAILLLGLVLFLGLALALKQLARRHSQPREN